MAENGCARITRRPRSVSDYLVRRRARRTIAPRKVRHGDGEAGHGHPEKEDRIVEVERGPQDSTQSRSERRLEKEATEWHPPQKPESRGGPHEKSAESADERGVGKDFHAHFREPPEALVEQTENGETEHTRYRAGHDARERHAEADGHDAHGSHSLRLAHGIAEVRHADS